jgi:tRNA dimethylallyltransferase
MKTSPKLLVIIGPTASGKTDLALALAKRFNGELIAADSRTIYKGMDIGTAKTKGAHLIDVVRPDQVLTLAQYKVKSLRAIRGVIRRGKLPILVGGTGLYVSAIVDNWQIPRVAPHARMRAELGKKSAAELFIMLKSVDPDAAARIGPHNQRRMIRALEVLTLTGTQFSKHLKKGEPLFDVCEIGISIPREELYRRIDTRVDAMMKHGFFEEVLRLRKKLYAPDLPAMSGIGYGELNTHIDGKISLEEAVQRIKFRTHQYARRQMTWFKRDARIRWISSVKEGTLIVKKFLT